MEMTVVGKVRSSNVSSQEEVRAASTSALTSGGNIGASVGTGTGIVFAFCF